MELPPIAPTSGTRFDALSAEQQIDQLRALSQRKRYALDALKKGSTPITLADFTPAQRLKFYEHLSRLPDAQR